MKLFSSAQIKEWDQYTIQHEPIASIDLMERAAKAFCRSFLDHYPDRSQTISIFCGPGNNGGDGLAIARMLHFEGCNVQVYCCRIGNNFSEDFTINQARLPQQDTIEITEITEGAIFPDLGLSSILIDGIFGTGLNRPVEGYWASLIDWINERPIHRVAIDIPSGLPAEGIAFGPALKAELTISFQQPKLSFLLPENEFFVGHWQAVPIGLASAFTQKTETSYHLLDTWQAKQLLQKRQQYSHKGTYGHALLICGSYGMMGAAQLCTRASLRSGVGLVSVRCPKAGYGILQTSVPEAMVRVDPDTNVFSELPDLGTYTAVGIGPGLGQAKKTEKAFKQLCKTYDRPMVIDADALNLLAKAPEQLKELPAKSILTPHPGEFKRLFGFTDDSWEAIQLLQNQSKALNLIIILKGAYTRVALPDGRLYFNTTGNPGMATGGSGDVLTGILTSLLAQGYPPEHAALLAVFLHGSAGDIAKEKLGEASLIASDLINHLGNAFKKLEE